MVTDIQKGKSCLRPRARIIKTIGEELISNDVIAIIELVKNSYDADSKKVKITFTSPLTRGYGSIIIEDYGTGMDLKTIKTAWMEPATNFKILKRKTGKGRKILGEKGIGRFAAAKLSDQLEMITKTKDDNEVYVIFNWTDFEDSEKYLDEIDCAWQVRKPQLIKERGTTLILNKLTTDWDYEKLRELHISLSRLINPVAPVKGFEIELILPKDKKLDKISGKINSPETLGNPDYKLLGKVKKDGELNMTYFSKIKNTAEDIREDKIILKPARKPACGPFSFEFRVWNREEEYIENLAKELKTTKRDIKRDLNEAAGISVYRDNFRVLPYGEPKNDWLRLDFRRVQNPTKNLSNNQIVGYVSINLDKNPELKDQSNREGIVESQAFTDLKQCIISILNHLEIRRYKEKRDKTEKEEAEGLFTKFDLTPVIDLVSKKLPDDKEANDVVREADERIKKGVKKVQEVLARYRRLSTLGQLLDVVLHDGNNILYNVDSAFSSLQKEFDKKTVNEVKIKEDLNLIRQEIKCLSQLFKRLEPFSGRKRGRPKRVILEEAIENIFELHSYLLKKFNIGVELPKGRTKVRLDESEFEQIMLNLLQNSIYWLETTERKDRKIVVEVSRDEDMLSIIFSDNGPGIKEEHIPYIFDPYFSTKSDGVGLGLTIVGELVTEYGGILDLIDKGPLDGATFKLTFRGRI